MEQSMTREVLPSLPSADKSSARLADCSAGQAVMTTGGNLNAKFVIHTVGPYYRDGKQGEARGTGELPSRIDPSRR